MSPSTTLAPNLDEKHDWVTVVFMVEDTLFRVPKYHFEKSSEVFQGMFAIPSGKKDAEGGAEGENISNPIRLEGVKAVDFRCLVEILYPPSETPWQPGNKTEDEWKSILRLATLWRFLRLRSKAIEVLTNEQKMDAVERILLGRELSVSEWIQSGYKDLIMQEKPLTEEQVEKIGLSPAVRIFRARETGKLRILNSRSTKCLTCSRTATLKIPYCNNCDQCHSITLTFYDPSSAQSAVDTEFAAEISQARSDGAAYQVS
ncbi:hypothetical protein D9758_006324 [Tetrapyrgos nigripes]|uniref:BTB domain-containing protein n=1 Tax=Tetrapyrgos nigripes TaxID=182062 RepID=A0A8H5G093_9AGAR|nr:hypothetical protein D9758_006324 [Tetrapyrgos nigripes]